MSHFKQVHIDRNLNVDGEIKHRGNPLMPSGSVISFAGSTPPEGYLSCDGSAVSRSTYSDLFSVIGITYGAGNGPTTFNLPNLINRMIMGSTTIGTTGGSSSVTLTTDQLPAHTHTGTTDASGAHSHSITDPGHSHSRTNARDDGNSSNAPGQAPAGDANTNYVTGLSTGTSTTGISIASSGNHSHTFTTGSSGSGNSFSVLNPFITLYYVIKY